MEITLGGRQVTLKAWRDGALQDTQDYVLVAGGFSSNVEAQTFGNSLRHALLAASAHLRVGLDMGDNNQTSWSPPELKGAGIFDDVHGLMIFPEEPPPRILSSQANVTVRTSAEAFFSTLMLAFDTEVRVASNLEVPIELYCASAMELSPVARLILAVSSIEAIAGRPQRPPCELALLAAARAAVKEASTTPDQQDIVLQALKSLQPQSARRAGRQIVEQHLPGEGATHPRPCEATTCAPGRRSARWPA